MSSICRFHSMHKLGYFVVLQTNTIFGIALHFLRNIKYHQEIWNNLSVKILWKFLICGHLVHSRPCPAAGHLDTARKILVFRYTNFLSTLFYHPCHSLFFDRDHLRSNMEIISGPGSFAVQYGDHFRSEIICGPIWGSFGVRYHLRIRTDIPPSPFYSLVLNHVMSHAPYAASSNWIHFFIYKSWELEQMILLLINLNGTRLFIVALAVMDVSVQKLCVILEELEKGYSWCKWFALIELTA